MADEAIYQCKGVLYNLPVERLRHLIEALQLSVTELSDRSKTELFVVFEEAIADAIKEEDRGRTLANRILEEATRFQDEVSQSVVLPNGNDPDQSTPPSKVHDQETVGPSIQAWRKDFKIVGGQILAKGTGLSYTSLQRQITDGLERGYTPKEVIEGVIRVVEHTSSLRHYLDGRRDMTIANLQCILRAHYKESSIADLYAELGRLAQKPNEDPQTYLLRALELKQKATVASDNAEGSNSLVQGMFTQSLISGFTDEAIHWEMRRYTESKEPTDEELIERLGKLLVDKDERSHKSSKKTNQGKVNKVQTSTTELVDDELLKLRVEVAALREKLKPGKAEQTQRKPTRRCPNCQEGNRCTHCFKCGSSEHYAIGCRAGRQGNGPRSLQTRDLE